MLSNGGLAGEGQQEVGSNPAAGGARRPITTTKGGAMEILAALAWWTGLAMTYKDMLWWLRK